MAAPRTYPIDDSSAYQAPSIALVSDPIQVQREFRKVASAIDSIRSRLDNLEQTRAGWGIFNNDTAAVIIPGHLYTFQGGNIALALGQAPSTARTEAWMVAMDSAIPGDPFRGVWSSGGMLLATVGDGDFVSGDIMYLSHDGSGLTQRDRPTGSNLKQIVAYALEKEGLVRTSTVWAQVRIDSWSGRTT